MSDYSKNIFRMVGCTGASLLDFTWAQLRHPNPTHVRSQKQVPPPVLAYSIEVDQAECEYH